MLELEEALARILATLPEPTRETVGLNDSYRRILLERIVAPMDLPHFDNSSMDGYAVRASDVAGAKPDAPIRLRLCGRIPAGQNAEREITAGECVRLFTGSPMPRGADAVVMQEDTRVDASQPNEVAILEPVKPWENIRFRGEDVKCGTHLFEPGEVLTASRMGLLAAIGFKTIEVGRRPRVALLATGSELRESGQVLAPGQIYESNRTQLAPLVESAGGQAIVYPIVPDDFRATQKALQRALSEADIVLTSGGVSVGELDFVKDAFEQLGGKLDFWKVAIKPGRPFVFGQLGKKFLFGLPGNPVSALVTFLLLARPALLRWQGATDIDLRKNSSVLAEPLENSGARRHFMRVRIAASGETYSAGVQASHILSATAQSNGLVDVPPKTILAAGETVPVLRWD